jgi:transposase-like protein
MLPPAPPHTHSTVTAAACIAYVRKHHLTCHGYPSESTAVQGPHHTPVPTPLNPNTHHPNSCPMCGLCCAGKTSTALAIARQLYGPELMKTRVMELNASDERGINVVRHKVCVQHGHQHSQLYWCRCAAHGHYYSRQWCSRHCTSTANSSVSRINVVRQKVCAQHETTCSKQQGAAHRHVETDETAC